MDLNTFWFLLIGVLLIGYAILDGFDLGVGALHLFARSDHDRRVFLNAIGPVWDGNEVWLVTFGGALFAAFPKAYATAFSGFYLAFMFLLCALIFRAVAIEFRSKQEPTIWRSFWDVAFFAASVSSSLLFGIAVGNLILGLPIGADGDFRGQLTDLVRPYALLVGFFNLSMFMMHGSIYLYLKTDGELQQRVRGWIYTTFGVFCSLYAITTIATLQALPGATRNFAHFPWVWGVVVLNVLAIANIPRALHKQAPSYAFFSSSCSIAALVVLFGVAIFPNMIISSLNPAWSLTIYNAASSQKALGLMRNIAFLGLPFVLTYTIAIYWVFRGKVKIEKHSY
ncbi:cytochrome D oxidase subunit I [Capsulimonas corticalis]|uniref:Cytochrome D oxidase subunit I n=1 Tax=Capsulimonas corticalis TaxID=2219043 RepID=A0A402D4Q7_9BACT|nr:cytochrome d ubiquinol oxidase subunit II [Capsulimonas corticalis]BDI31984.1 cytochrome D oxidase subunit I [Capsulimonas corticalis]